MTTGLVPRKKPIRARGWKEVQEKRDMCIPMADSS